MLLLLIVAYSVILVNMLSYSLATQHLSQLKKFHQQVADLFAEVSSYPEEVREAIHRYAKISMMHYNYCPNLPASY